MSAKARDRHPSYYWRRALMAEHDNPLPSPARMVGVALSESVNPDGEAWPGVALLARRTGLTERSVRKQIQILETHGYIELVRRGGGRHGRKYDTNRWRIAIPSPEPDSGFRGEPGSGLEGTRGEPHSNRGEPGSVRGEPHSGRGEPRSPELERELETERDIELAAADDVCPDCGEQAGMGHKPVDTEEGHRWCHYSPRGRVGAARAALRPVSEAS